MKLNKLIFFVFVVIYFMTNAYAGTFPAILSITMNAPYGGGVVTGIDTACKIAVNTDAKINNRIVDSIFTCDQSPSTAGILTNYKYHTASNGTVATSTSLAAGNKTWSCPSGTTISGSAPNQICTDVCTPPNVWNIALSSCANNCASQKDAPTSYFSNTPTGADQCLNNCTVQMTKGDCGQNSVGVTGCFYDGIFTGASCAGSSTAQPPTGDGAFDCIKAGKSYGLVNGLAVCVAKGTVGSAPITSQSKDTKSTTGSTSNTSSTTNVTEIGDSVTKTTTKTNADGTTTSETTEQTKGSFCDENPNNAICKAKTACEDNPEGPECKHICEKFPDVLACASVEVQNTGAPTEDFTEPTNLDLEFNEVSLPQLSGCPSPININLSGHALSISFDPICQYSSYFQPVVVAFAYLTSAMIIASTIKL